MELFKLLLNYAYLILVNLIKWGSIMVCVAMFVNVFDKRNK